MESSQPLVSIVMPVYNVEKYLQEAVESVLRQTYTNWELILVDDKSTDSSGLLCDGWAKRDERIRVIHRVLNGGPSAARNTGMADAKGDWILFPDSDDIIANHMLERMLEYSKNAEVVICMLEEFPKKVIHKALDVPVRYDTFQDLENDFCYLYERYVTHSACTKLYKKDSIHITFDENVRHVEDLLFNLAYLPECKGIQIIPDVLYRYRREPVVTVNKQFWMDTIQIRHRAAQMIFSLFPENRSIQSMILQRYVRNTIRYFLELCLVPNIGKKEKKLLLEIQLEKALKLPGLKHVNYRGKFFWLWKLINSRNIGLIYIVFTIIAGRIEKERIIKE